MSTSWKLTARGPRQAVEEALAAQAAVDDWEADFVVGARELPEAPQDWLLEAWLPRRPTIGDTQRLQDLFAGEAPQVTSERLGDVDWVSASRQHARPVVAGPFRVRTPDFAPLDQPGLIEFEIPAAQAFGTGQHATTAGCLEMLAAMKARRVRPRNVADVGTGTGLLAFAALALWPQIRATATDNDPVCADSVLDNATRNGIALGNGRGALAFGVAEGVEGEQHEARGPYDLIIANILARPLMQLAPDFAAMTSERGHVLLSGLLVSQEAAVRASYRRAGFRLVARLAKAEWSILWLRRRYQG